MGEEDRVTPIPSPLQQADGEILLDDGVGMRLFVGAVQGVDFLPFPGTAVYPRIMRGQDAQIALPGHDGLLGNGSSPVAASDLNGRALHAEFLVPVTAVGVWVNQGDGGALEAYDASDTLILSAPLASGGFAGITSPAEIARVRILCTFNADIRCGWYGFQFCDP